MKFGQLIEYNMRNIFLEKSYTKYGGETSPRPFSEKLKLSVSLDQYSKFLHNFIFIDGYRNILKLSCRPLAFTSYKASFSVAFCATGCLCFMRYWTIYEL